MKKTFALTLIFCLLFAGAAAQLIPQPVSIEKNAGQFVLSTQTGVIFDKKDKEIGVAVDYFIEKINSITGIRPAKKTGSGSNTIRFQKINQPELGGEGYLLTVDSNRILIEYNSGKGAFYAVQSLLQYLPMVRTNDLPAIPNMRIKDYPRFAWRGMMLDVSRHFFTVETIKKTLDMMAFYKLNTFHWHLCDNEGWRLEIKKYPDLTCIGAWREDMPYARIYQKDYAPTGNPYRYGGFYTQEEAKEVVAYAKKLNITVIPEIEMPGHSGAALAAYPQLSCNQKPNATPNALLHQSPEYNEKFNQNFCAGNDDVFRFLQDVLDEVMTIFPSEYIHIGGDEVDKKDWKRCSKCQNRIKTEGLENEEELQSYFIKRMEKYLLKHHRKLLGWDEILEGGLAESATVMSWRGEAGGIKAAKMGHHVVMSPSNPLYFIRHQDSADSAKFHAPTYSINTLDKVYAYNPTGGNLTPKEQSYILGSQCAVWSEFMPSVSHYEYMVYPRITAFAETVWTPVEKKDFTNFVSRLNSYHFPFWQMKGIRFHPKYFENTVY